MSTFFDAPQLTTPPAEYDAVLAGAHFSFAVPAAATPEQASTSRPEISKLSAVPDSEFDVILIFSYLSVFSPARGVSP